MAVNDAFGNIYRAILCVKFNETMNMKVTVDNFTFECKTEGIATKFLHIKVSRGLESVGGSIRYAHPTCTEIFEIELDLFLMFAQEWHNANPVQERAHVESNYRFERRMALCEL